MYLEAQAQVQAHEYVHVPDIHIYIHYALPIYRYLHTVHTLHTYLHTYLHTNPHCRCVFHFFIFFSFFLDPYIPYIPYIHIYLVTYLGTLYSLSFAFRKRGEGVRDSRTTRLEVRYISDDPIEYIVDFSSKVGTYRYLTYLTLVLPASSLRTG